MKKTVFGVLFVFCTLTASAAFAGGNVEKGGDGVVVGKSLYSLDLVEYGLEEAPLVSEEVVPSPSLVKASSSFLSKVSPQTRAIVLTKMARMQALSKPLYDSLLDVFKDYSLVFVRVPLAPVHDAKTAVDEKALYQVASHDDRVIRVNLTGYERMDTANQSALIVHELLYASFRFDTDSRRARRVTAYLFDRKYVAASTENFKELAKRYTYSADFAKGPEQPKFVWDPFFSLTALLMHFDGADGSTLFRDVLGNLASSNGVTISSGQFKFGGSSGKFSGNESFITLPSEHYQFGAEDFTVEFYVRTPSSATGTTSLQGLVEMYDNGGPYAWGVGLTPSHGVGFTVNRGTSIVSPPIQPGVWYHIAAQRRGAATSLYVNGVLVGMQPLTGSLPGHPGALVIGAVHSNNLGRYSFAGNIDELRITKGLARYAADFAPPTAPFASN